MFLFATVTDLIGGMPRRSCGPVDGEGIGAGSEEVSMAGGVRPAGDHDALPAAAMRAVEVPDGAEVAVAVLDAESGESAAHGNGRFATASIVVVDILAALLLQALDEGRGRRWRRFRCSPGRRPA